MPSFGAMNTREADSLRPVWIAALVAIEILVLLWAYSFSSHCFEIVPNSGCLTPSLALRATAFLSVFGLMVLARSNLRHLLCCNGARHVTLPWVWVQIVGFCLIMLPSVAFRSEGPINLAQVPWLVVGGLAAVFGAAFAVTSPARCRLIIVELGPVSLALLVAALLSPEISVAARDVWYFYPLTQATFQSVLFVLKIFGVEAIAQPADYVLSSTSTSFSIQVGGSCSGVEGLGLTTLFLGCYFHAFKQHLRFPNVWMLLPIALIFSWALNVVRIATLFSIGTNGNQDLAVSGFHSHAGWLMFTISAFTIIGGSTWVPWFRRRGNATAQPLLEDWTAARTLPFAAFMGSALLLSTFTLLPDLWYFVKVLAISSVIVAFLPVYRNHLIWRPDAAAVLAGVAIGLLWIAFGFEDRSRSLALDPVLASLPLALWVGWVLVRLIGTVALVPVAEELIFRGYLLDRFAHNGQATRVIGLLLSTGLFAVMHGRWALAGCAGLVYGLLYLRSSRVTDSIVAHSASNAIIGLYALATAQWSLI
jgi:exosortase E/protease (VPEID-CTERM system)